MEGDSSQVERGKDGGHGKKKRRGGIKFSGSKALRRSAMRKKDAPDVSDDDHMQDLDETIDEFHPGRFRRNVKIRTLYLDAVTEDAGGEDEGERLDWNEGGEELESRKQSQSRSGSQEFERDSAEKEFKKVVSSKGSVGLQYVLLLM